MESFDEATASDAESADAGSHSADPSDIRIDREDYRASSPDPEEGLRLMRSFLGIRQAALRHALTEFVTQISALTRDDRRPSP
jgi:hypothetical protein